MARGCEKLIFGCAGAYRQNLPFYLILFAVQVLYTIITWASFLDEHFINTILLLCYFPIQIGCGIYIVKLAKTDEEDNEYPRYLKCAPCIFLLMTVCSFIPCFIGFFEFIGNLVDMGGGLTITIFSAVFSTFWLQAYFVTQFEVKEHLGNRPAAD